MMGKFLESEKKHQIGFKLNSDTISPNARIDGLYKKHTYPFCLPREYSLENLYPPIREEITEYFRVYEIKWHDAIYGNPSNHMCDSMVCCANFLFPFAGEPVALKDLLTSIFPEIQKMLLIENDQYVAFEWIGAQNYLGEKVPKNGKRKRGAHFTSVDAAVMFERIDGLCQVVLIEWKYTESYGSTNLQIAKSGTDRSLIYRHLFENDLDLINKDRLPSFEDLFYEPFYQFMRQQYLADEMEKAHELGADIVSVLHIAPAQNQDFRRITSPNLQNLGGSATEVWTALVKKPKRFFSISTEDLFGDLNCKQNQSMIGWSRYINERYSWMRTKLKGAL